MSETLTVVEIEQLARFDEHWRVCLAGNNRLLAMALAKRGYLDVLKRWMPLYRLNDLGREALSDRAAAGLLAAEERAQIVEEDLEQARRVTDRPEQY
jgi:hypothetical protein